MERGNLIKVHYMHVWEFHNETPLYDMLIKMYKNNEENWKIHKHGLVEQRKGKMAILNFI
jgi:hypothetical protein